MEGILDALAAETGFSGVVRVDRPGRTVARAYGHADRAWRVPNTVGTRFALASVTKGFTALTVAALIERGTLALGTPARELLRDDLPLIGDEVTVEHLLAHTSGIGDYCDEDVDRPVTDHVLPVPVHELTSTEDYLTVLGDHPPKFPPGQRFSYCNSGYVVLALIAERAARRSFAGLVHDLVCVPAGMTDTGFPRSDEPTGGVALGYLDERRTNVFHLPVVGSGDGGACSTAADLHAFWAALFAGRIVPLAWVREMTAARNDVPEENMRYGLGFRLDGDAVLLEGYDAGVSCRTVCRGDLTYTVLSNTSEGAWPIARRLAELTA
ncbi:serine hydrolase domain-containing protein [Amycolatopsis endophytica]|uniref:CubicO group peptidase (Beta-lactamase class C family) n=1 Tax=Amycolatopsis endophytica TaxID=860233 RepID=A0A853BB77_9PSEU|nr:serine hydrolase domain-containing protein [Amycolatopsis endophytica]NYI92628.1 CubicO group peptidase (beta-lactamase class C family) [Amycolatopsis endophytica]